MVNARILGVFELIRPKDEATVAGTEHVWGVRGVIGLKKLIGVAALAVVAMIGGAAAEASTLSFNLQSADYNYSWIMDADPTVSSLVDGFQTNIKDYVGQAIGSSAALPSGGEIYFYSTAWGGALGFQDSLGLSLFDFSGGDTIYDDNELAPHFSPGIFAITFNNHPAGPYIGTLTVATVAATPIPAALPLFASALGGMGFIGWRRRKNAAAA
jgi:hypothetical protein